jgi:site-specific DNA-methyltransferase (adenine-specific)
MKSDRATLPGPSAPGGRDGAPANGAAPASPLPPAASAAARRLDPSYHDDLVAVYHADATDLSFLAERSVQLVVTSPPYNLGKDYGAARDDATYQEYLHWVGGWCRELYRVLEPGGRLCLNIPLDINLSFDRGGKRTTSKQPVLADFTDLLVRRLGFVYNTTILWLEGNVSRRTAWGSWLSASDPWVNTAAETILVLSRDQRKRLGRGKTSDVSREEFMAWTLGMWTFNGQNTSQYGHPAPFPEELPRRLIKLFSFREDVVLDPFLGSGTTCRVAKNLGRRSIGVELNPEYCAIAANRCRQTTLTPVEPDHGAVDQA